MNKTTKDEFVNRIKAVCQEFGVSNVSLSGNTDNDTKFFGMLNLDMQASIQSIIGCVINTGRLWQYARVVARDTLDSFEKLP